ncbi:MAG: helix-turn-helix domain-containing protein [Planctomycetota bacterium]
MSDEFFSFDEALDELRLKEEELKRLVSEGEIRAFRKGDTMKLRRSDVESLRAELSGGEIVDLGESTEELVFEDDIEDVGELELEEDVPVVAAAPIRRQSALSPVEEEESESLGMRVLMIASALVLTLSMPVAVAISTGNADDLAKSIAEIFVDPIGSSPTRTVQ